MSNKTFTISTSSFTSSEALIKFVQMCEHVGNTVTVIETKRFMRKPHTALVVSATSDPVTARFIDTLHLTYAR